jgi:hypothetical protein
VGLKTRRFLDMKIDTQDADTFMVDIMTQLPDTEKVAGAVCRVQLTYPRDWESLLDEKAIQDHFGGALSVQIQKHRQLEKRSRLGDTLAVESLTPEELLKTYWQTVGLAEDEAAVMQALAAEVLGDFEH